MTPCHLPLVALEPSEACPQCSCRADAHRNHPAYQEPPEAPAFGVWQPIETAPEGNGALLVYEPRLPSGTTGLGVTVARRDGREMMSGAETWVHARLRVYPTHWMKLPEPPK